MENIRSKIRHPALRDAFDADWYYPLELTDEHKKLAGVKRAIKEGWAEWIETEEDIEAIFEWFMEAESDDLREAYEALDGDYDEEILRLVRLKFLSEVGN